jgi:metallo-beta-lactamase family protein
VLNSRGKLIIPAFSVGRTQLIVYYLNLLWNEGRLPRIPVYVDSPLSTSVTGVFRQRYECCSDELRSVLLKDDDPFGFETLTYIRDAEKSKQLNDATGPMIIISASGMCEAGRILHHLRNGVGDSRNVVLVVGYMAENTLGRRIREKQDVVKIFGEPHEMRAHVEIIDGFSAHGDQDDLLHYAEKCGASGRLKKIFLVHGEADAQAALTERLNDRLPKVEVIAAEEGAEFAL